MPTKREIQQDLDMFGIEYPGSATKTELEALLADALTAAAGDITTEDDTAPSGGAAVSFKDVTGLCRQCGKPADHLHQGV